jgi:hypothetical protein
MIVSACKRTPYGRMYAQIERIYHKRNKIKIV